MNRNGLRVSWRHFCSRLYNADISRDYIAPALFKRRTNLDKQKNICKHTCELNIRTYSSSCSENSSTGSYDIDNENGVLESLSDETRRDTDFSQTTLSRYFTDFHEIKAMEPHVLSNAVYYASKHKLRKQILWKSYLQRMIEVIEKTSIDDIIRVCDCSKYNIEAQQLWRIVREIYRRFYFNDSKEMKSSGIQVEKHAFMNPSILKFRKDSILKFLLFMQKNDYFDDRLSGFYCKVLFKYSFLFYDEVQQIPMSSTCGEVTEKTINAMRLSSNAGVSLSTDRVDQSDQHDNTYSSNFNKNKIRKQTGNEYLILDPISCVNHDTIVLQTNTNILNNKSNSHNVHLIDMFGNDDFAIIIEAMNKTTKVNSELCDLLINECGRRLSIFAQLLKTKRGENEYAGECDTNGSSCKIQTYNHEHGSDIYKANMRAVDIRLDMNMSYKEIFIFSKLLSNSDKLSLCDEDLRVMLLDANRRKHLNLYYYVNIIFILNKSIEVDDEMNQTMINCCVLTLQGILDLNGCNYPNECDEKKQKKNFVIRENNFMNNCSVTLSLISKLLIHKKQDDTLLFWMCEFIVSLTHRINYEDMAAIMEYIFTYPSLPSDFILFAIKWMDTNYQSCNDSLLDRFCEIISVINQNPSLNNEYVNRYNANRFDNLTWMNEIQRIEERLYQEKATRNESNFKIK